MSDNQYTGETPVTLGDQTCTLIFDWRAFAAVKTIFKERGIEQILSGFDVSELTQLLLIGLKRKNPEITKDNILDLNPPPSLPYIIETLNTAITRGIYGGKLPDTGDDSQSPPEQAAIAI